MISKIDYIKNFAIYNNFVWDDHVRDKGNNKVNFEKLNIFYGRNYSGKTTLSRVFNSFEEKEVHPKYLNSEFQLTFSDGNSFNQNNIEDHEYHFRVYNSDFVNRNLRCLIDEEGAISPFAIVGDTNQEIEKEIESLNKKLGTIEPASGLYEEKNIKYEAYIEKKKLYNQNESKLEANLKQKAKEIKENAKIYNKVTYQIRNIKDDIEELLNSSYIKLTDDEIDEKKKLLKENIKKDILLLNISDTDISNNIKECKELLCKKITPTKAIQDLLNDTLLQKWVKDGIDHHKKKRTSCAFCGQDLPSDLWEKLDSHFSKESELLINELEKQIKIIENLKLEKYELIDINLLYSSYHDQYLKLYNQLNKNIENYNQELNQVVSQLESRVVNTFKETKLLPFKNLTQEITELKKSINLLFTESNSLSDSLSQKQDLASKLLRKNEVNNFITSINYKNEKDYIEKLKKNMKSCMKNMN
ncbi:hypothetical protein EW093_16725 [Thiospirochaeta perfilievii]|uniref:Protein CR006 P-loop domain-containing protein n=1 Tax=Thiospirochaeta perfilievii TaxID=252967 RepID=A0A5C1QJB9_9SPIO|nr:AAA family ATPase [Thiospirochaeta perfilievii]QEN06262.1 hypothetical protein EW093_16725 [Thiospirochaeta perfilievii]